MVVKVRSFGLYSYQHDIQSKWSYCNLPCNQGVEALTNWRVKSRLHFFLIGLHQLFTIKPRRRAIDAKEVKMKKYLQLLFVALFATMSFALTSCGDDDDENPADPRLPDSVLLFHGVALQESAGFPAPAFLPEPGLLANGCPQPGCFPAPPIHHPCNCS